MKHCFICLIALFGALPARSQHKVIEKTFEASNRPIELEVEFASEIEVKTWDRDEVYFKADLTVKEGYLDLMRVDFEPNGAVLRIHEEAEDMFKKYQKDMRAKYKDEKEHWWNDFDYEFTYVLYVPKNAHFKVSSINGNLNSSEITGDFEADLINGNIDIARYSGDLKLRTINGEIDLVMRNTSLQAETIHGHIYAAEGMELESEDQLVGQEVRGRFQDAKSRLHLNTINGNMYLRQ